MRDVSCLLPSVTIQEGSESRENGMTQKGLLQSSQEIPALFAQGGQITANATKVRDSVVSAKTAGDLLLDG
jgi:hypothetical protein